ncbi:helix-turn-helix domain-containing protein [Saccharopolyspora hattusasensis]|uniref:helix-turn-helix domain-containing protein n=1 Tax=Saccharopolyspora hattusasensis TaxID=1128679 RepID=UPI003D9767E8
MGEAVPTLPRLFLGEALRQLREDSGRSLDAAAAHIGKNRQRLIRLLDGKATLTRDELERLITFLGAGKQLRRELAALGEEARKKPNDEPYTDLGPGAYRRVAYLEAMATTIHSYEKGIFPALVQSPAYVEALMGVGHGIWWDEIDDQERLDRISIRLERQRLVLEAAKPKQVHLLFTDDAFDAVVGDSDVMYEQSSHLLDLIKGKRDLTVQVVPTETRGNPAQQGGLTLFDFGGLLRPVGSVPVVYGPATYFDKEADTGRLARAFNKIQELALSPSKTVDFLEQKLRKGI